MTQMDNKNAGPTESPSATSPSTADTDLASLSFSSAARGEAVANTVIFEGTGFTTTQTVPEVVPQTQGGASVPVTLIYGKNGSITFQAGELGVAEGPETILDQRGNTAAPSSAISFHGDISRDGDSSGVNAGESVEVTSTYRAV